MVFPVVTHKDISLAHHLKAGPFPSNFSFSSFLGLFLRDDEDLGCPREVVDVFKSEIVYFTFVVFWVHDDGSCPLGLDELFYAIEFCNVPII